MKVILKQDVRKVGKKGDTVNVSDGYGQNYLIKNGLAVLATATSKKINQAQKAEQAAKQAELKLQAELLAKELKDIVLEFTLKSKDGNTFGSISTKQIVEALSKNNGIKVDKRKFLDSHPISALGYTNKKVELFKDVIATIRVHISEEA